MQGNFPQIFMIFDWAILELWDFNNKQLCFTPKIWHAFNFCVVWDWRKIVKFYYKLFVRFGIFWQKLWLLEMYSISGGFLKKMAYINKDWC